MPDAAPDALARECALFCRYLADVEATPDIIRAYRRAHEIDGLKMQASTPMDHALLRLASGGTTRARLADAFAGPVAPGSALRRKLVVLIAILESRGGSAGHIDHATSGSRLGWIAATALYGFGWLLRFAVAAVLIVPLRLWYGASPAR
jgi:hypothetical protein